MPIFTVEYTYVDDDQGRDTYRAEHRAFLSDQPGVLLSGPYLDYPAGALIIVQAEDESAAAAVMDQDPFQREGLIAERRIREYSPVLGSQVAGFEHD